ncbi:MAG TPA: glycosyltransferase family 1 protein [Candidatus Andersenbacteria bacterium]|nr:glycosyltransferase family 1 protein [Candidatus Andersenbacteria bacterium]
MRIGIDARAYGWAGIGRYTRELLCGLSKVTRRHQFVVAIGRVHAARARRELPRSNFEIVPVDDVYYSWREQTVLLGQLARLRADVWHFTHFNIPLLMPGKYVVTIHDLTRFIFPGQTQQSLLKQVVYECIFQRAVARAAGVICVSAATEHELRDWSLKTPLVARVIPEAVGDNFTTAVTVSERVRARMLLGRAGRFILYVGVWMSHKNLPRLLAAYVRVRERYPDVTLVLTGRPKPGYVAVDKIARSLGLSPDDVLYLGFVPDALLPALYAEASCLALPSLYEGFGLTALEAAAAGTPVVASNVSSLPEILREAYWVNPEYVPSIAAGIAGALQADQRRQRIIAGSRAGAVAITWEEVAKQTLAMYEAAH